jgi:maltooligosyltrehalose trehalohydrolase
VRSGRRREFAAHGWAAEDIPDPQADSTLEASTLLWSEVDRDEHAAMLQWYRDLIALRRREPELSDPRLDRVTVTYDATARWVVVTRGSLRIVANLATESRAVPLDRRCTDVLLSSSQVPDSAHGASLDLLAECVVVVRVGSSIRPFPAN